MGTDEDHQEGSSLCCGGSPRLLTPDIRPQVMATAAFCQFSPATVENVIGSTTYANHKHGWQEAKPGPKPALHI